MSFRVIPTVKSLEQATLLAGNKNTQLRINSSHLEIEPLIKLVNDISLTFPDLFFYIDLQGCKIRISRQQPEITLNKGEEYTIVNTEPTPDTKLIHVNHSKIIQLLSKDCHVKMDDGKLEMIITEVTETYAKGTVLKGGLLKPGKGFNLQPHPLVHNELSQRDIEIVEKTKHIPNLRYALSFVSVPSEIEDLKKRSNNKFVAAKIERSLETDHLLKISQVCDEIWLCRGDGGVQLGLVGLAKFVQEYNKIIHTLKCPTIMAGEVMEFMCNSPEPSRSEVCHLADLIQNGYDGIVLSNETVAGKYPKEALDFVLDFSEKYLKTN